MSEERFIHTPRLFVDQSFTLAQALTLSVQQFHYLKHVMRFGAGDVVRVFNGQEGEWLAAFEPQGKKQAVLQLKEQLKPQGEARLSRHLIFSPLKKQPLDVLIEKAVELGVTDLHPVLYERSAVRHFNEERAKAQIIEASEQCERLDVPELHDLQNIDQKLTDWPVDVPIMTCLERLEAKPPSTEEWAAAQVFMIGPEGGFAPVEEQIFEKMDFLQPVSLGPLVLRAETAAIFCLCMTQNAVGVS